MYPVCEQLLKWNEEIKDLTISCVFCQMGWTSCDYWCCDWGFQASHWPHWLAECVVGGFKTTISSTGCSKSGSYVQREIAYIFCVINWGWHMVMGNQVVNDWLFLIIHFGGPKTCCIRVVIRSTCKNEYVNDIFKFDKM